MVTVSILEWRKFACATPTPTNLTWSQTRPTSYGQTHGDSTNLVSILETHGTTVSNITTLSNYVPHTSPHIITFLEQAFIFFLIGVTNYQLLNITNVFAHRAHGLVCTGDEAVSSFRVVDVFVLPAGRSSIVGLGGMLLHRDPWMSSFDIDVGMYTSAICIRSSGTASTI